MKLFRFLLVLILGIISLTSSASAGLISSFESDLDGWTVAPGTLPARATVVSSFTSFSDTISPTDGLKEAKLIAGFTPIDPAGTQFASILKLDNSIHVNTNQFLIMDVNLAGRQPRGQTDWIGISINNTAYSILTTDAIPTSSISGWKTFAIKFLSAGSFNLDLLCVNGQDLATASYCAFDHIRTADVLPSVDELARYPLVGGSAGILSINLASPVTPVPEPETWSMLILGLFLTGLMGRARNQHPA